MFHDIACPQVEEDPRIDQEQVMDLLEMSCRSLPPTTRGRGRPPVVTEAHLCLGIALCFLRGWHSQRDLWRLLGWHHVGPFAPIPQTDQAIYNRLAHADEQMHRLFQSVSQWVHGYLSPWEDRTLAPFAHQVLALDESTLDRLSRWLPHLRHLARGDKKLLAGRLCGLFDVRFQQWVRVEIFPDAGTNCKVAAVRMLEGLGAGTLLLFDRGYFSFPWLDELTRRGLFWITRYANNASYTVLHTCYQGDGVMDQIVWLGNYRTDQAQYPVRLVSFYRQGKQYRYLTNVLKPDVLSVEQIARLYARRWDIEIGFRLLKDYLGVKTMWSAKWPVVRLQIWTCLLLSQLFYALQRQVATEAKVEIDEVSLDLLVRLTPRGIPQGEEAIAFLTRCGREIRVIRPSRRVRMEVPWIDPAWVSPPPPEAMRPREKVRYGHRHGERGRPPSKSRSKKPSKSRSQARSPN